MGHRQIFDIVPSWTHRHTYWQTDTVKCPRFLISSHTTMSHTTHIACNMQNWPTVNRESGYRLLTWTVPARPCPRAAAWCWCRRWPERGARRSPPRRWDRTPRQRCRRWSSGVASSFPRCCRRSGWAWRGFVSRVMSLGSDLNQIWTIFFIYTQLRL